MIRVVVDTNVFVSGIIGKNSPPARLLKLWESGKLTIITTAAVISEIERVLNYPKIKKGHNLGDDQIRQVVLNIARYSVDVTKSAQPVSVIKEDPDDDKFLSAAVAGKADFIISGDAHLLTLKSYEGIPIVTPSEFFDRR